MIYKSDRVNEKGILIKMWLLHSLIFSIPFLIDLFFPSLNLIRAMYWYILISIICIDEFISVFKKDRINEILIDIEKKQVILKYYVPNKGEIIKLLNFENLKIRIDTPLWTQNSKINLFYFLEGETKKTFEISWWKDGFSFKTLKNLINDIESLTIPLAR